MFLSRYSICQPVICSAIAGHYGGGGVFWFDLVFACFSETLCLFSLSWKIFNAL